MLQPFRLEKRGAWAYPASRAGDEFINPHDEAIALAREYHTEVLSANGDKVERVNEKGESTPQKIALDGRQARSRSEGGSRLTPAVCVQLRPRPAKSTNTA